MTNADRKNWLGTWQTDFPCLQVGIHTPAPGACYRGPRMEGGSFFTQGWGVGGEGILRPRKMFIWSMSFRHLASVLKDFGVG